MVTSYFAVQLVICCAVMAAGYTSPRRVPAGGQNSPQPKPPPQLIIGTTVLSAGSFKVHVPVGKYTAPIGGAANYSVPGPIVAFTGPDGIRRGHGYLETYPRLLVFEGRIEGQRAQLEYSFEQDKSYKVILEAKPGVVLIEESCDLGPRNRFVFDCFYNWQPKSGFAFKALGVNHAFLYLPCYYDKPEVTVQPLTKDGPGAVAVVSPDPSAKDIAGFFVRDSAAWLGADSMGIQLWQRRQFGGEPGSRHYLGPETKSDSTPNPRTADMLGTSLYEGHVTIELNLGTGTRQLGFAVTSKGGRGDDTVTAFKTVFRENAR